MDKIICLGKNFHNHAAELGEKQPPFPVVFSKFPSILKGISAIEGETVELSDKPEEIHHELEVVIRLGRGGSNIKESEAHLFIDAVTVGLDLTDRPLQEKLKAKGHPWAIAKNFLNAAIVGPFIPLNEFPDYLTAVFSLIIDGKLRQTSTLHDAIFKPNQAIAYISALFPLAAGDLIYMGTPTGVGPLRSGQTVALTYGPIDITFETVQEIQQSG